MSYWSVYLSLINITVDMEVSSVTKKPFSRIHRPACASWWTILTMAISIKRSSSTKKLTKWWERKASGASLSRCARHSELCTSVISCIETWRVQMSSYRSMGALSSAISMCLRSLRRVFSTRRQERHIMPVPRSGKTSLTEPRAIFGRWDASCTRCAP